MISVNPIYTCLALDTNVTGTVTVSRTDGRSIVYFRQCHYDEYTRCRKESKESRAEFLSFTSCVTHTQSFGGLSHRAGKNFRRVTLQLQFQLSVHVRYNNTDAKLSRCLLVFVREILNFPAKQGCQLCLIEIANTRK